MIYEYRCDPCRIYFDAWNSIENRANMKCPECGEMAKKVINTALRATMFPEGWWSNIGPKPIYVSSASQLAEECKKRWTPSNKPWPEYLDGISTPGVPSDVKYKGAEGHKTGEELCKIKEERLKTQVEMAQYKRRKGLVTS